MGSAYAIFLLQAPEKSLFDLHILATPKDSEVPLKAAEAPLALEFPSIGPLGFGQAGRANLEYLLY